MPDRQALQAVAAVAAAENEEQLVERLRVAVAALGGAHASFAILIHRPPLDPLEHVINCSRPPTHAHAHPPPQATAYRVAEGPAPYALPWREALGRSSSWHLLEQSRRHGESQGLSVAVRAGPGARSTLTLVCEPTLAPGTPAEQRARDGLRLLASALHVATLRLVLPRLLARLSPRLTERELTCLHWVARGKSDGVVGTILGVTDSAVHFHMTNVLRKMGVSTRTQAVAKALALGLVR